MIHSSAIKSALASQAKRAVVSLAIVTLAIASLASVTYDTTYTDASGARCATFVVGSHEADLCHGRTDR